MVKQLAVESAQCQVIALTHDIYSCTLLMGEAKLKLQFEGKERAVEEVLLREVILRFRKKVETQELVEMIVVDDGYAQMAVDITLELYSRQNIS